MTQQFLKVVATTEPRLLQQNVAGGGLLDDLVGHVHDHHQDAWQQIASYLHIHSLVSTHLSEMPPLTSMVSCPTK